MRISDWSSDVFSSDRVVCVVTFPTHAGDPLTLDDAFQRVANTHPNLRLFGNRRDVLEAELDRASLRPALVAGASIENAFGTGEASGLDGAEITLSLASVLERGGKVDARRTLAQSRIDALALERSEEHTSELQSLMRISYAVFCLKKKKRKSTHITKI